MKTFKVGDKVQLVRGNAGFLATHEVCEIVAINPWPESYRKGAGQEQNVSYRRPDGEVRECSSWWFDDSWDGTERRRSERRREDKTSMHLGRRYYGPKPEKFAGTERRPNNSAGRRDKDRRKGKQ